MATVELLVWGSLALATGSFLNVLIHRVPDRKSMSGRSRCPQCGGEIGAIENIPIISFIFLRGRCARCKSKISWSYPLVEIASLILALVVLSETEGLFNRIAWYLFVMAGLALAVIDAKHFRLPNVITLPLALSILVLLIAQSYSDNDFSHLKSALLSSTALTFFYLIVNVLSRGGMGLGDVKFSISIGLLTGYLSSYGAYIASMAAFFAGSIIGISLMISKGGGRKRKLPFGPFMYGGTIASLWLIPIVEKAVQ